MQFLVNTVMSLEGFKSRHHCLHMTQQGLSPTQPISHLIYMTSFVSNGKIELLQVGNPLGMSLV
jgi:hypothetical protein